jgi:hypothetical protein
METEIELLILKEEVKSRFDRRQSEFERIKLLNQLIEVEQTFVDCLFDDIKYGNYSYEEIYRFFLIRYIEKVKWVKQVIKPVYYNINEHYFLDTFEPIEEPFEKLPWKN